MSVQNETKLNKLILANTGDDVVAELLDKRIQNSLTKAYGKNIPMILLLKAKPLSLRKVLTQHVVKSITVLKHNLGFDQEAAVALAKSANLI